MSKRIIVNPLTRISGFMEIDVTIEQHKIVEAKTKGNLFRGFEKMLLGRNPFDTVYFTQRICGICSAAHSTAASLALEDALQIKPMEQGKYLRDLLHCCEFLQNHIRHFYQYTLPDYVKIDQIPVFEAEHEDFRLPQEINNRLAQHYFDSLPISRLAHQMLALLGGKAPHNHGVFIGGITTQATAEIVIQMNSMLDKIITFIDEKMIPDMYDIASYYPEYFKLGKGYGNLLTFGAFDHYQDLGTLYVNPSVLTKTGIAPFDENKITESIDYSWFTARETTFQPGEVMPEPDQSKKEGYSWVKAPRYDELPFEVGPLARLILSGMYENKVSAMDRSIARVLEAKKIATIMKTLLHNLIPDIDVQKKYDLPEQATGRGLVDTTRGALGHWLKIDEKKISFYQIITPSTWDFSTRDERGLRGVAEEALIGTPIQNPDKPGEIGRILRSFDPCMSCATHVYRHGEKVKTIQVL